MWSLKEQAIIIPTDELVECCKLGRRESSDVPGSDLFILFSILAYVFRCDEKDARTI